MLDVRLAKPDDSNDIFEWRNDSVTRKMSHNTEEVLKEEHETWFKAALESKKKSLLICTNNAAEKIGIVRFDIEEQSAEVSINLNPEMRGKGLARQCLKQAMLFFNSSHPDIKELKAEIKDTNIASKKIFEDIGFKLDREDNGIRHYKMHEVIN
jgi:RimJ/RimL family protein N-acetyltransferase